MQHISKRTTFALLTLSFILSLIFFALANYGAISAHAAAAVPKAKASSVPLSVYFGSDYDQFYALNAASGALRWKYQYQNGGNQWSHAYVVNGIVYFEVIGGQTDAVEALNASDGSVVWNYAFPPKTYGSFAIVVANGMVYFVQNSSNGSTMYALHANDGSVAWTYAPGSQLNLDNPTVANGMLYASESDAHGNNPHIYTLDASNGTLIRSFGIPGHAYTNLTVANGVIYLGIPSVTLYALDANTGNVLWKTQVDGGPWTTPVVVNGVLYFCSGVGLTAVKASDGSLLWDFPVSKGFTVTITPTVVNGVVYFGDENKYMHALNATTGAVIWQHKTGAVYTAAAVANGIVYVGLGNKILKAFNANNGKPLWGYQTNGYIYESSPPTVG